MKRYAVAVALATTVVLLSAGPALGQMPNQQFTVVSAGPPGAQRTVVASGVFNSVGTEVITSNPPGSSTMQWVFPEGTLFVTTTYTRDIVTDPATCLRTITLTGTWKVTAGTGQLVGASGSGAFSGPNRVLLTRAPDGSCVPPPIFLVQVFRFTGQLSLAAAPAA